jgi:hypothetical protein
MWDRNGKMRMEVTESICPELIAVVMQCIRDSYNSGLYINVHLVRLTMHKLKIDTFTLYVDAPGALRLSHLHFS